MAKNKQAIFLMGPTASGKTALALSLAKIFPIEIISVDSALIYRDLNIGSAKPTLTELAAVPHHLIDILSPLQNYSVADFLTDCNCAIDEIYSRGKLPVLVGGTMMYFNALMNGISKLPEADYELRAKLELEFAEFGNQIMHERLMVLDPASAAKIEVNDTQRIERALEVCYLTGKPMSQVQTESKLAGIVDCDYLPLAIVPSNRALLHQRINLRFDQMLADGFIKEVRQLQLNYPELTAKHNSMRMVGYSQAWNFLVDNLTELEMVEQGKAATRQLAKRQITWLRSMECVAIDDPQLDTSKLLAEATKLIEQWMHIKS